MCLYITESICCTPETNRTVSQLFSNKNFCKSINKINRLIDTENKLVLTVGRGMAKGARWGRGPRGINYYIQNKWGTISPIFYNNYKCSIICKNLESLYGTPEINIIL